MKKIKFNVIICAVLCMFCIFNFTGCNNKNAESNSSSDVNFLHHDEQAVVLDDGTALYVPVAEITIPGYIVGMKIYSYEVSGDTIVFTTCVATHNGNDEVYDKDTHTYYYKRTDCTYTLVSQRLFHMENIILAPFTESRIQESMSHTKYLISSASYQNSEFKSFDHYVK